MEAGPRASLIEALRPEIEVGSFDVIVDASSVEQPKPDKAAYVFALERLDEQPDGCVAIEDNLGGVEGAQAAGLRCEPVRAADVQPPGGDEEGCGRRVRARLPGPERPGAGAASRELTAAA